MSNPSLVLLVPVSGHTHSEEVAHKTRALFQVSLLVPAGGVQVQVWGPLHWGVCGEQETWPGCVQLSRWIQIRWSVQIIATVSTGV